MGPTIGKKYHILSATRELNPGIPEISDFFVLINAYFSDPSFHFTWILLMRYKTDNFPVISIIVSLYFILIGNFAGAQIKKIGLVWEPRQDLNILLPASVRLYETNGTLPDSTRIRAIYATVDLRDENLKLRAVGSNALRETTLDTHNRHDAILAINGGYFASNKSQSMLVSDGELVAPGPTNFTRGAFGLVNRKPQIVWPYTINSTSSIFLLTDPVEIRPDQSKLLLT